jgi:pre-mRNA-splicing factor SYF1
VAAQFNTDVAFIASQAVARGQAAAVANTEDGDGEGRDAMAALERQVRAPVGFVAASTGPEGRNRPPKEVDGGEKVQVAANPDAIDVDIDDD